MKTQQQRAEILLKMIWKKFYLCKNEGEEMDKNNQKKFLDSYCKLKDKITSLIKEYGVEYLNSELGENKILERYNLHWTGLIDNYDSFFVFFDKIHDKKQFFLLLNFLEKTWNEDISLIDENVKDKRVKIPTVQLCVNNGEENKDV